MTREAVAELAHTRCANTATGWRIEALLKADPEKEADTEAQAGRFLLRRAVVAECNSPMPGDTMGMSEVECVSFPNHAHATPLHQAPTIDIVDAQGDDDYWCQSAVTGLVFANTVRFNRRLVQHSAYPNKDLCRIVEKIGKPSNLYAVAPRADQVPAAIPDLPTAARFGQVDKVRAFLDARADPGQVDALKLTALEWAVLRDYRAVYDLLADLPWSQRYCAAASTAIRYRRPEMAANLAGRCNEPDLQPGLASAAAESGYLDVVKAIVERGLDLNNQVGSKSWSAPLQHAALGGHPEVVQYLLDRGAGVDYPLYSVPNNVANVGTPLYHAIMNKRGNADVVRVLLERGAHLNNCYEWMGKGSGDKPALLFALSYGTPEIVKVLVGHGAPLDGPANPEQAYKCAAERWKQEKHTPRNLEPPIFSVLWDNTKDMLELLLQLGANPNVLDSGGATPLIAAIVTNRTPGHSGQVRVLLAHKADPNLRSRSSLAPLHHAAQSDRGRDIVDQLLEAGADISIRDNDGRTPLDYASDLKLDYMAAHLKQRGARSGRN